MEYFYNLFRGCAVGAVAAGLIFELRMHTVLPEKRTIRLFPIRCTDSGRGTKNLIYDNYDTTVNETDGMDLELPELRIRRLELKTKPQANSYCTPDSSNFPSVDSLLFSKPPDSTRPILLMFRMTRSLTHDTKVSALKNVDGLGLSSDVRRYYVAVTPWNVHTQINVPMAYFTPAKNLKKAMESPNEVFPVFHHPVLPTDLFPKRGLQRAILDDETAM